MKNYERDLALEFVLNTNKNVFLTGKAGTGKTTLLKEILRKSTKQTAVVAPTGVAAINAGGMTIHSMFQLPTKSFVPNNDVVDADQFMTRIDLATTQKIRRERRLVLQKLELLVIDEISMVRADLFDAIDFTLRRLRRDERPFGGVQLLVIGDLNQLSPVVRNDVWPTLSRYYNSPFFFSAHAWKGCNPIKIQLNKIYRQDDEAFIRILNNVRDGVRDEADIEQINERYVTKPQNDEVITLTTHNRKADAINQKELNNLKTKTYNLVAKVKGQFNQSSYPTEEQIQVKKDSQIMFIRNNNELGYYNGKIGKVLGMVDDELLVKCQGDTHTIHVKPIEWKNTKYSVDKNSNKVVSEDVGTFSQYPIKLAWAVTVHKSQGLTFDRVILDLADTFAAGQLYVALSRCRSLEGIQMTSKISPANIIVDQRIMQYHQATPLPDNIENLLQVAKEQAEDQDLIKQFNLASLLASVEDWEDMLLEKKIPEKGIIKKFLRKIKPKLEEVVNVSINFQRQLQAILQLEDKAEQNKAINDRCSKAIDYLTTHIYQAYIHPLEEHSKEYGKKKVFKTYLKNVKQYMNDGWTMLNQLYNLKYRGNKLYTGTIKYEKVVLFDPDKVSSKPSKGNTYKLTLQLFEEGRSIDKIAKIRDLSESTIESHIAKLISEGKVDIYKVVDKKMLKTGLQKFEENPETSLTAIKGMLPEEYTFGKLRMIQGYMKLKQNR